MNKLELFYGLLIGLLATLLGAVIFIVLFTDYGLAEGVRILKFQGQLGKLITLGALLNLIVFFLLLKYKKELIARGVVLATIILTVITLLV